MALKKTELLNPETEAALVAFIRQAIMERRQIVVNYDPGIRSIEPHALGLGAEGQLLLRAYQVAGSSEQTNHSGWRLFRLDRIARDVALGGRFQAPRPDYKRDDIAMKGGILVQL